MRGPHLSPAHGHRGFTDGRAGFDRRCGKKRSLGAAERAASGRARAGRANVSCFLGSATYVAAARLTKSSDATLIHAADRGLYPATNRGDNRVGEEASRCRD